MRRKNIPDLDARVQTFIHEWEELVTQQLQATKVKLLWSSGQERAQLKSHLETLAGVADLLQGRRSKETCDRELSEEISGLKAKLGKSEANVQLLLAAFQAQKKLNKDLKVQLRRQFKVSLNAEKRNQELRQQIKNLENQISPVQPTTQAPADQDLQQDSLQDPVSTRKEVQAQEQEASQLLRGEEPRVELKERRRRRRERPTNEQKSVARIVDEKWEKPGGVVAEKKAESGGVAAEKKAGSGVVAAEKKAESGGVAAEKKAESWGMAADLRTVLLKVYQQLNVQHQGLKELLDQQDQRWGEKFQELRSRMEKLETKRKRRSWF